LCLACCRHPAGGKEAIAQERNNDSPIRSMTMPCQRDAGSTLNTYDAVGYFLSLLRSYLTPLSKADLRARSHRSHSSYEKAPSNPIAFPVAWMGVICH